MTMVSFYRLKDYVTNEMLESAGFYIPTNNIHVRAARSQIQGAGRTYITKQNEVLAGFERDISDLIDKGWLKEEQI